MMAILKRLFYRSVLAYSKAFVQHRESKVTIPPMSTAFPPSPITVRTAEIDDAPIIAALIRSLERHYASDNACSDPAETQATVQTSMEEQEGTRYALAFDEGNPVGLACFALLRPGFNLGGLLFLKELYVAKEARGRSVGTALMAWLAEYARARQITRIDLTTDRGNVEAQKFYEALGGVKQDKVFYRFFLEPNGSAPSSQE
ncbi:GNAT family N-acetyltransferase [Microvirga rosea]|uniref:GNAT family N-acetyltransferase n=1 Tax=Microvirga rosea TaxID=2715425 RepID=UPI001D0A79C5|nr:GNAT family N-acetyltransferase [Microvirga rosea]